MIYDNTNSGILRANKRREKETHPTHTGTINVGGVDYWLSAWVKEGKPGSKLEGERYFSLSVKPKEERSSPKNDAPELSDDIPF